MLTRDDLRAIEAAERIVKRAEFSAEQLCFPEQLRFVRSAAKRKVARCSRRAGKTTGVAFMLLEGAMATPYAHQVYVTISLKNARRLVWPALKRLNQQYDLGGVVNETEAYMRFPRLEGEPHIFLGGAKDREEIEKLRGYEGGAKRYVIDEAQSMRQALLQELTDDVIEPALFDYDGELVVIGTPGPVMAGYFHDIDIGSQRDGWEHFFWTMRDNPWLERKSGKATAVMIAELLKRRGWTEDHPTFRREYCGEWLNDPDALVLKYREGRNHYDQPPPLQHFVLGVDIGHDDADAIAVLGWSDASPDVYLVEEYLKRGATVSDLAERVQAFRGKYEPRKIVADFGGLGKKIGEEMRARWSLPVEPADKQRKIEHVALLNDALVAGRLKARRDSAFAQDCALVQWDADARAKGELKIASEPHSDIVDAVLYAFRACRGYQYEGPPPPKPPVPDELEQARMEAIERGLAEDWWNQDPSW